MKKFVITVGREYGSGGRELAKGLAKRFKIKCYDKELIRLAAKESGLHEDFLASCDEKAVSGLAFSMPTNYYFSGVGTQQIQVKAYFSQFSAIKALAEKESCVIVGRVADFVLREHPSHVSVFVSASLADRVERVMAYENISDKQATALVKKNDKNRASYYNFFSDNRWGEAKTYDVCVNTSKLGIEKATDVVYEYVVRALKLEENAK